MKFHQKAISSSIVISLKFQSYIIGPNPKIFNIFNIQLDA